jgi:hypothetical protein
MLFIIMVCLTVGPATWWSVERGDDSEGHEHGCMAARGGHGLPKVSRHALAVYALWVGHP